MPLDPRDLCGSEAAGACRGRDLDARREADPDFRGRAQGPRHSARDRPPGRHSVSRPPEPAQTPAAALQMEEHAEGGNQPSARGPPPGTRDQVLTVRIIFFGTPEFAVPSLRALLGEGFEVATVVTQPDKSQGRSRSTVVPPPVKQVALEDDITVLQPERPSEPDFVETVRGLEPDIGIVVAYGDRK